MKEPTDFIQYLIRIIRRSDHANASVIADALLETPGVHHVITHPESRERAWVRLGYPISVDIDTSNQGIFTLSFYEHDLLRYRKQWNGEITDEALSMMLSSVGQIASDYSPFQWSQ